MSKNKETIHAKGVKTDLYHRFSNEFVSFIDCQIWKHWTEWCNQELDEKLRYNKVSWFTGKVSLSNFKPVE